jgi:spore coat protein U-like protein
MTVYTQVFGGANIYPSELSYRALSLTISTVLEWPLETAPSNDVVARIMDVNATGAGLSITMPDATEASTGETVLFNNVGSETFTVRDSVGNTICAPQSGTTFQIYLTNNSTEGGTWQALQYGAARLATEAAKADENNDGSDSDPYAR